MRLLNGRSFELQSVFSRLSLFSQPAEIAPVDFRPVADVFAHPVYAMCAPDQAPRNNYTMPVNPGNPNITMGLGPVVYDGQPQWDRGNVCAAGPVVAFFKGVLFDNRVKHV